MQINTNTPKSPAPIWNPPGPSLASREVHSSSRGACRPSIVGGANPREIRCESGLERKAALFLLAHPQVADLREQPPAITWNDAVGRSHRHTFDFLVILTDDRKLAVAVKPKEIADRKRLGEQFVMIAAQLPRGFADGVLLLTDEDLPRDLVHDAALMHQSRRAPDPALDERMLSIAASRPDATIAELIEISGHGGPAFRSVVRLAATGKLIMQGHGRIGHATRVSLPAVQTEEAA